MMKRVLRDIPHAHPYIDYVIVGSDGETGEELVENHTKEIRGILKILEDNQLVASQAKSAFFQRECE